MNGEFQGRLNPNLVFGAIFNMIISQLTFADNIKGTFGKIVGSAKVDGSLYGDTKLYYSTDALKTHAWGGDAEMTNLLKPARPKDPKCQKITLDVFRQIDLTLDSYLTKQAWKDEYAFSQFNAVMLSWLRETKRIYDSTIYNSFLGNTKSLAVKGQWDIYLKDITETGLDKDRKEAMVIANAIAMLKTAMEDVSRFFNDYKQIRSYDWGEVKIIWNATYVNRVRNVDLPTIFHKDIMDKFGEFTLPERYFGDKLDGTTPDTNDFTVAEGIATLKEGHTHDVRSLVEMEFEDIVDEDGDPYHIFAGDEIPVGAKFKLDASGKFEDSDLYLPNPDKMGIVVTQLPPYMSAFEVATSFFNAKALNTNHYLTFGHNTLEYLKGKPFIVLMNSSAQNQSKVVKSTVKTLKK